MNQQPPFVPIAVTGIGMITTQGLTRSASWAGIRSGVETLRPWEPRGAGIPASLATVRVAQCPPPPCPKNIPLHLWRLLARTQQLACLCADEALRSAALPEKFSRQDAPAGCFLATSVCGMDQSEQYYAVYRRDRDRAPPAHMRRLQPHETLALLARRHHLAGPCYLNLTTCVGSAMAIGAACDAIHSGKIDLALAGGTEALCRLILTGFHSLRLLAADGCRPFDRNRPGITVGEGAAILVLESLEHAYRRGARPIGFIRGFAATCDAHHITKPDPGGVYAAAAITGALAAARLAPDQIDYVNAHGTGTRDNDAVEARVLQQVFRTATRPPPPVSSTKRLTGHTFAAAGAIEAAICLLALADGLLPPNSGLRDPDPACDLPLVRRPTAQAIETALSCNFAFGGNNTALVFSKTREAPATGATGESL